MMPIFMGCCVFGGSPADEVIDMTAAIAAIKKVFMTRSPGLRRSTGDGSREFGRFVAMELRPVADTRSKAAEQRLLRAGMDHALGAPLTKAGPDHRVPQRFGQRRVGIAR